MKPLALTRQEIKAYLSGHHDDELFAKAKNLREKYFGKDVYLRGIIEFSNYCQVNCNYCGLRIANKKASRYSLTDEQIFECIDTITANNLGTIVFQSGENTAKDIDRLAKIITTVKKNHDLAITLSLGEHNIDIYKKLKDAGADRYLMRVETFDESIYQNARPGRQLSQRLKCIDNLKQLNYEVGSGFMVGLPGETVDSLTDNIIRLTAMDLDMIGIGPFIAHPQTPFKNEKSGDYLLSLRTLALVKILNPLANMPSTSAMESAQPGGRLEALKIGMNVVMPAITPANIKGDYNIYPGKNTNIKSDNEIHAIKQLLSEAGYRYSGARGDSLKYKKRNKAATITKSAVKSN